MTVSTQATSALCLMYHALGGDGPMMYSGTGQYTVGYAAFCRHVEMIRSSGAPIVGFRDLDQPVISGDGGSLLPVCLTFDDGHRSNVRAAEHLAECRMMATFFMTRNFCTDSAEFCSPGEIRKIRELGMTVGAHGCTHRPLSRMPADQAECEMKESKEWLEDILGEPVDTMSAPGGVLSRRDVELAVGLGYRLVGNSREAVTRVPVRGNVVNRVCVRRQFADPTVHRILRGDSILLMVRRLRQGALALPKLFVRR